MLNSKKNRKDLRRAMKLMDKQLDLIGQFLETEDRGHDKLDATEIEIANRMKAIIESNRSKEA